MSFIAANLDAHLHLVPQRPPPDRVPLALRLVLYSRPFPFFFFFFFRNGIFSALITVTDLCSISATHTQSKTPMTGSRAEAWNGWKRTGSLGKKNRTMWSRKPRPALGPRVKTAAPRPKVCPVLPLSKYAGNCSDLIFSFSFSLPPQPCQRSLRTSKVRRTLIILACLSLNPHTSIFFPF